MVEQTKIIYKEKELLQLVYDHLVQKGLDKSASILQKEAGLSAHTSSNTASAPQTTQLYETASSSHAMSPSSSLVSFDHIDIAALNLT